MIPTKRQAELLRSLRVHIEDRFHLRTESVSMLKERWTEEYPNAPQIAIVMADPNYAGGINAAFRAMEEEKLLDLLTTPDMPLHEIDRTPTRVWLAVAK